ncbi:acetolactate synthase small subunit [Pelagibaculum spongiae]|uniref:Acetolactate synthase small subunit n=1 Tax=Pelagibaculum spongiae TaxID=2080658 RepID=A0A2V1GZF5_9GAMM|nr:acetolactate synthase small subunit [Pelagibaculum spongiae]PVZ72126.1 acetolactate synthase small subunit [Pelagibaculum spongiae]
MRHLITMLVENEAGALCRVASLFSARGYNIESLAVAPIEDSSLSRLTVVTQGDDATIEQITKQLNKLLDVVRVADLTCVEHVERELMLIKMRVSSPTARDELTRQVEIFRGQIVDIAEGSYTVQLTGKSDKLDAFVGLMREECILELNRTGPIGMSRGEKAFRV